MIIKSLLDTDQYKLTMQQFFFHQFPGADAEYELKLRNYRLDTLLPYKRQIEDEINNLCRLRFTKSELRYLQMLPYFKDDYIEYLRYFQLQRKHIIITEVDGELKIKISGPILNTILFEVPDLSITSEIVMADQTSEDDIEEGERRLEEKIEYVKSTSIKFADFGTRRRYSYDFQDKAIGRFATRCPDNFIGTSNLYFAKKYAVTPIGTMAHELIQAGQALTRIKESQGFMFQKWADEYRGSLGIALSDTLGMDVFFKDFDLYFAKLFDGARQDSGNPVIFGERLIKHYEDFKIDPKTKTLVCSDGLNFKKSNALHERFNERINCSFGIGTYLTNDSPIKPLQIVIKMTRCNDQPVAKISDSPGKLMCKDKEYLRYLKYVFDIKKEIE